jgi:hypothetical protein
MSRKSIDSRMDRIMSRLLPPGSIERAEYDLSDFQRAHLLSYRQEVAAIISRATETGGPGHAYELIAGGQLDMPAMPSSLAKALGIKPAPHLPEGVTVADAERGWNLYRDGGK